MNLKNFRLRDLFNRNSILVLFTLLFMFINSTLYSYLYDKKYDLILDLEQEQKIANEKFITAQILSEKYESDSCNFFSITQVVLLQIYISIFLQGFLYSCSVLKVCEPLLL